MGITSQPLKSHLPSTPPSHRQGTWFVLVGPTGPLCSSANSSWSFAIHGISRSLLCHPLEFWEGCTERWIAAQLYTEKSRNEVNYTRTSVRDIWLGKVTQFFCHFAPTSAHLLSARKSCIGIRGVMWSFLHLFLLGIMPLSTSWWFLPIRIASQEPNLPL